MSRNDSLQELLRHTLKVQETANDLVALRKVINEFCLYILSNQTTPLRNPLTELQGEALDLLVRTRPLDVWKEFVPALHYTKLSPLSYLNLDWEATSQLCVMRNCHLPLLSTDLTKDVLIGSIAPVFARLLQEAPLLAYKYLSMQNLEALKRFCNVFITTTHYDRDYIRSSHDITEFAALSNLWLPGKWIANIVDDVHEDHNIVSTLFNTDRKRFISFFYTRAYYMQPEIVDPYIAKDASLIPVFKRLFELSSPFYFQKHLNFCTKYSLTPRLSPRISLRSKRNLTYLYKEREEMANAFITAWFESKYATPIPFTYFSLFAYSPKIIERIFNKFPTEYATLLQSPKEVSVLLKETSFSNILEVMLFHPDALSLIPTVSKGILKEQLPYLLSKVIIDITKYHRPLLNPKVKLALSLIDLCKQLKLLSSKKNYLNYFQVPHYELSKIFKMEATDDARYDYIREHQDVLLLPNRWPPLLKTALSEIKADTALEKASLPTN